MVGNLCNSFLFHHNSPSTGRQLFLFLLSQVPPFFQAAILLSPKLSLSLPAQLSFVAAPNTMTAPETPTSTKTQCLLIPECCEKGQEYKGQEKKQQT